MLTGGSVSTAATAADAVHSREHVGWDPYEVWRTRVLLPRLAAARDAPPPELAMKALLPEPASADGAALVPRKPALAVPRMPASVPRAARAPRLPARRAVHHVSRALGGTPTAGSWAVFVTVALALLVGTGSSSDAED